MRRSELRGCCRRIGEAKGQATIPRLAAGPPTPSHRCLAALCLLCVWIGCQKQALALTPGRVADCRIAHRDLKLENLLLVNQRLKIADFDLCSLAKNNVAAADSWITGSPCGTVAYASPELLAAGASSLLAKP